MLSIRLGEKNIRKNKKRPFFQKILQPSLFQYCLFKRLSSLQYCWYWVEKCIPVMWVYWWDGPLEIRAKVPGGIPLHTIDCILNNVQLKSIMYNVYWIMYTVYCTMYTSHGILHNEHSILHIEQFTLYTSQGTQYTAQLSPYTVYFKLCLKNWILNIHILVLLQGQCQSSEQYNPI